MITYKEFTQLSFMIRHLCRTQKDPMVSTRQQRQYKREKKDEKNSPARKEKGEKVLGWADFLLLFGFCWTHLSAFLYKFIHE